MRREPRIGDKVKIKSISGVSDCPLVQMAMNQNSFIVEGVFPMPTDEYPNGVSVEIEGIPYCLYQTDVEIIFDL